MKTLVTITIIAIISALCSTNPIQAQSLTETIFKAKEAIVKDSTIIDKDISSVGQKQIHLGKMTLQSGRSRDLGEVLATNSAIYIKSMGRGSLATASIRGTSSNHTQVIWNGMPINSSMVSGFDFSSIPTFFLERVSLSLGAADPAGMGNVLGGTILLESAVNSRDIETLIEYGSNNTQTYGFSAGYTFNRIKSSTRVWYQSSDNDFKFLNKVLSKDPFYANRTGSDYKNLGAMQQFSTQVKKNIITADIWAMWSDRSLPQPIVVSAKSAEYQQDFSLRSTLSLRRPLLGGQLTIRGSWLLENLKYERDMNGLGDQYEKNKINTFLIDGNYTSHINKKVSYRLSVQGRADINDAYRYSNVDRYTLTLGSSTRWKPSDRLSTEFAFRFSTFDDHYMPTGSLGAELSIIPQYLSLSTNIAYNYHAPTLNDLYWQPGGNPDLNPEQGISQDLTLKLTVPLSGMFFKFSLSTFRMDIDDWIVWLPTERYYWTPRNLNRVRSQGVETSIESLFHIGKLSSRVVFNYTYTDAANRKASFEGDASVGVQLPYVPRHKWNINLTSQYKNLTFNYYWGYTGKRFTTTDQSYFTEDYKLHSASLEYGVKIAKQNLIIRLTVDNLFDTYWESTQYYPQPLRTFNLKAIFRINTQD